MHPVVFEPAIPESELAALVLRLRPRSRRDRPHAICYRSLLGVFAFSRKAPFSFIVSLHPSARM